VNSERFEEKIRPRVQDKKEVEGQGTSINYMEKGWGEHVGGKGEWDRVVKRIR